MRIIFGFITVIALALSFASNAQTQKEIKREGNTFSLVSNRDSIKDEGEKTPYTFKDSKDVEYPIFKSKKGTFFIKRISKKTGKEYRQYLPKELQEQLKKG